MKTSIFHAAAALTLSFAILAPASGQIVPESKVETLIQLNLLPSTSAVLSEALFQAKLQGPGSCRITVVRPPFAAEPVGRAENELRCTAYTDASDIESGTPSSFLIPLDKSPIEYFGTRWQKHVSFIVRGELAEALRSKLGAQAIQPTNPLLSSDVICDRTFDFCIETLNVNQGPEKGPQISCSRWSTLNRERAAELTPADFELPAGMTGANYTTQFHAVIAAQLSSQKRVVTNEFCAFHASDAE